MAITKIQSESLNLADTYAFTGTVTGASTPMTPAFEAELGSNQTGIGDNVYAKCNVETEIFDTDNCYDNSTNYRFTPTVAGKYYVYGQIFCECEQNDDLRDVNAVIYKNGSIYKSSRYNMTNNFQRAMTINVSGILDMNGSSDYVELYGVINVNGSSNRFYSAENNGTYFGAYRILT